MRAFRHARPCMATGMLHWFYDIQNHIALCFVHLLMLYFINKNNSGFFHTASCIPFIFSHVPVILSSNYYSEGDLQGERRGEDFLGERTHKYGIQQQHKIAYDSYGVAHAWREPEIFRSESAALCMAADLCAWTVSVPLHFCPAKRIARIILICQ